MWWVAVVFLIFFFFAFPGSPLFYRKTTYVLSGAKKMVQWVKCLPRKHANLSGDPCAYIILGVGGRIRKSQDLMLVSLASQ